MTFRSWLSIITFGFIIAILWFTRHELVTAWKLLTSINLWILLLLIPLFFLNYYAVGEMVFSYLEQKGLMENVGKWTRARIALETNFVNHVLPSGGASGMSYMTWRLGNYGVPASKGTMAQVLRTVMGFAAFVLLLTVSVFIVTVDGGVNRFIILVSSSLVSAMIAITVVGMYALNSTRRTELIGRKLTSVVNTTVKGISFGKVPAILNIDKVLPFMNEMHHDYLALKKERGVMKKPFIWSLVFLLSDVLMFFTTFWALGAIVNPAAILIAYGIATVAGFAVITPGGSGAYEALMVGTLAIAGVEQGLAMAGIVFTRVIILLVIIVIGYAFYQHALVKYGKQTQSTTER